MPVHASIHRARPEELQEFIGLKQRFPYLTNDERARFKELEQDLAIVMGKYFCVLISILKVGSLSV